MDTRKGNMGTNQGGINVDQQWAAKNFKGVHEILT